MQGVDPGPAGLSGAGVLEVDPEVAEAVYPSAVRVDALARVALADGDAIRVRRIEDVRAVPKTDAPLVVQVGMRAPAGAVGRFGGGRPGGDQQATYGQGQRA